MDCYDVQRLIKIEAIKTEIMGMEAENQDRFAIGYTIAYKEDAFFEKAKELRILGSKPNYLLCKEE